MKWNCKFVYSCVISSAYLNDWLNSILIYRNMGIVKLQLFVIAITNIILNKHAHNYYGYLFAYDLDMRLHVHLQHIKHGKTCIKPNTANDCKYCIYFIGPLRGRLFAWTGHGSGLFHQDGETTIPSVQSVHFIVDLNRLLAQKTTNLWPR